MINNLKKLNVTLQTCLFYIFLLKQLKYYINQQSNIYNLMLAQTHLQIISIDVGAEKITFLVCF